MQVLTVHSPFRVENLTNQQLEFNVHLFRGPQALGAPSKGAAAISIVPNKPLSPGQQTYLPVPAIWFVTNQPILRFPLFVHVFSSLGCQDKSGMQSQQCNIDGSFLDSVTRKW